MTLLAGGTAARLFIFLANVPLQRFRCGSEINIGYGGVRGIGQRRSRCPSDGVAKSPPTRQELAVQTRTTSSPVFA